MEAQRVEHAEALAEVMGEAEMYRYLPHEPFATVAALRARLERTTRGPSAPDERWWNWTAFRAEDATAAIGFVELSLVEGGSWAYLAYGLGAAFRHRGYASEACRAAIAYARTATPAVRLVADVDTRNAPSIALVERLGFARQESRANVDYFKGSPSDEYRYVLPLVRAEEDRS